MLHYINKDLKGKIELLRTKFPSERAFASEVKVANTTLRAWLNAGYAIRDDAFARLVKSMVRHGIISKEEGVKLITEKRAPITSNAVPVSVDKIPSSRSYRMRRQLNATHATCRLQITLNPTRKEP